MTFQKGQITNPAGRAPKKLGSEQLELIELLAERGSSETTIAHQVGVSMPTWNRLKERSPKVAVALARGRAREHDYLVGTLHTMASKGNVAAPIFLLKARHHYTDQPTPEASGPQVIINLPGAASLESYRQQQIIEAIPAGAAPLALDND